MAGADLQALEELARILEELRIPFVVGGSVASSAWGEPRSTHGVDLLVRLLSEGVVGLARALARTFYVDEAAIAEAVRDAHAFNVIHLKHYQKIDVFVAGDAALDTAQLERAVPRRLGTDSLRSFPVTSAEVLVVRKLDWFRRGGEVSERQWRDVLSVLRVQGGRLDRQAMEELARETGLAELMQRAIDEAWGATGR